MTQPDQPLTFFHKAMSALVLIVMSAACAAQPEATATPISILIPASTPTVIQTPLATSTLTPVPILLSTAPFICNEDWQSLPVIPTVTDAARRLYQEGIKQGNDPHAFSKIGDGEISTQWFLTDFDLGEGYYDLGSYQSLSIVIENFQGSFGRKSIAARGGFNTNLILDPSVNDSAFCNPDESPLTCELRIHNPAIAILSLGANQAYRPAEFESGMRHVLEILISKNVVPILSTKGDNLEGDHRINRVIACLAQEYQIPLWNFWAAIQSMPNHGLQPDFEHVTYSGINDFGDPFAMQSGWTVRNLTALQVLDMVWRSVAN